MLLLSSGFVVVGGGVPMLATLLLLLLADPPKLELDKEELKKLEGNWSVAEHEHGGVKTPLKDLANLSLEIAKGKMTTREAGDLKEATIIVGVDHKVKPAALDLKVASGTDMDKTVRAIYKLDGDTLTICVAEPGKDRPKKFEGKKDSGHTRLVFKKVRK
jgi:uncharacterized protein (TIGR03067 family)